MMVYKVLGCCGQKSLAIITLISSGQLSNNDDPGMPGGDPDLPNAPLDAGVYLLFLALLIYGTYKIRSRATR